MSAFLFSCERETKRQTLNVLFISIDDLNDWVGVLGGHPNAKTPNIDRLAAMSVLFTNAYAAAPICNPSRAALLTGVQPFTSGIYDNKQPMRESEVLKDALTLPQYFRKFGYKAMGSGKIFHYGKPDPVSWDYYWPSLYQNKPDDPFPTEIPMHGMPKVDRYFDWGGLDIDPSEMGDSKVAEWVSGQLQIDHEKPFFLACGIYKPHLPWYVPQKYLDMYPLDEIELPLVKEDDLDDIPFLGQQMADVMIQNEEAPGDSLEGDHLRVLRYGKWKEGIQAYLAALTLADECLGKVLDALDRSKYKDNTIVVLWSDHGWHLGEKYHWRKGTLWEESTRSLLMFKAPCVTQPGTKVNWPVGLIDVYPTLLDLAGLPAKEDLEGNSLRPLLKNPAMDWDKPVITTHRYKNQSIRSRHWRYTRYSDDTEELYHHKTDSMEWNNLASLPEYQPIKSELARWLPKKNAPFINYTKKK